MILPWYEGVIAGLDFETTGVDPRKDRPVQVAAVLADQVGITPLPGSFTMTVNPGMEIDPGAMKVHGITQEQADNGASPEIMVDSLLVWLQGIAALDIPLVIFNAEFDWTLMLAEIYRAGHDPGMDMLGDIKLLDPSLMETEMTRRTYRRKLTELTVGKFLGDAHDATNDAMAAIELARDLALKWPRLRMMSAGAIAVSMKGWNSEWSHRYNAARKGQGKWEIPVGQWPIAPRRS